MRERVLVQPVDGPVDAEAAFLALVAGAEHGCWLDSAGLAAGGGAGWSILATSAEAVAADRMRDDAGGVLDWLRRERAAWDVDTDGAPGPFPLGLVGWLGYEVRAETLGLPVAHRAGPADAAMLRVDRALVIDHGDGDRAWLLARGHEWTGEPARWRDATLATLAGLTPSAVAPAPEPGHADRAHAHWATTEAEYLDRIRLAKHAIADGDAYQLCLTTQASVAGRFDAVDVYRRLRAGSPSHHGAYLRSGGTVLLSASPEQFLAIDPDGTVQTKPIKGTRPRSADPARDAALAEELRASDKERAENLMIVDLMRNDLARVCEVGTVEVTSLLAVESYPHVHQLVSTVRGRLGAGRDAVDALRACFPAGSMTGAPKRSAVEILDRLEGRPRGIYSGAFGYLGLDGAVDLAMTIRSIVLDERGATVGAGGGITALSVPEEEVAEVRLKAAALLAALDAR